MEFATLVLAIFPDETLRLYLISIVIYSLALLFFRGSRMAHWKRYSETQSSCVAGDWSKAGVIPIRLPKLLSLSGRNENSRVGVRDPYD